MMCIDAGLGAPHCRTVCNACRDWAASEALQWRHHPGAGAAHVPPHPDAREALCGAFQPGRWPEAWEAGTGGLRECEVCKAAA